MGRCSEGETLLWLDSDMFSTLLSKDTEGLVVLTCSVQRARGSLLGPQCSMPYKESEGLSTGNLFCTGRTQCCIFVAFPSNVYCCWVAKKPLCSTYTFLHCKHGVSVVYFREEAKTKYIFKSESCHLIDSSFQLEAPRAQQEKKRWALRAFLCPGHSALQMSNPMGSVLKTDAACAKNAPCGHGAPPDSMHGFSGENLPLRRRTKRGMLIIFTCDGFKEFITHNHT